jgi:hypothetical protein
LNNVFYRAVKNVYAASLPVDILVEKQIDRRIDMQKNRKTEG